MEPYYYDHLFVDASSDGGVTWKNVGEVGIRNQWTDQGVQPERLCERERASALPRHH